MRFDIRRPAILAFALLLLLALGCGGGDETMNPVSAPAAPSSFTVTSVTPSEISLSWLDNSGNETGFSLERTRDNNPFAVVATLPANTLAHTDTGLSKLTEYCYRLQAVNATGSSAYTDEVCVETRSAIPAAPTNLAVSSTTTSAINLIWTDNSNNEESFEIERANGTTTNFSHLATTGAGVNTYSDSVGSAQTFTYRVRAHNSVGDSAYSNSISGTTGVAPPNGAPTNLRVTSRTTEQISLAWNDNSTNETGFLIERAPGTTSFFAGIGSTGANVATFTDTEPEPDQTFRYRIRATNAGGTSAASGAVTAKTLISYMTQIHPNWLNSGCTGCHDASHPSLNLTGSPSVVWPLVNQRSDVGRPCDSLILKKPSTTDCDGAPFPHGGDHRWDTDSTEYRKTAEWIGEGAQNTN